MQYTHDAIIIGAGIAGSAMALALSAQGLRIALLDKQLPSAVTPDLNLRVSNINFASEQFLKTLGVIFPDERRGFFKEIKIWQENNIKTLEFSADLLRLPYLGSIIENNVLVNLMHDKLREQPQSNCYWPVTTEKFVIDETSAAVHVSELGLLTAPLLISAEGAHSTVRSHCGILQNEQQDDQTALVTHIEVTKPHQHIAYQRFLNTGPLAYLPLFHQQQCSIVWSSAAAHIDYLLALDDKTLGSEIASGMLHYLGNVKVIAKRASFPLTLRHAQHYIAPRIALVGDTIHTLHPLAGQGANLGLMDVACLANVIKNTRAKGRDIGEYTKLRPYERERRLANTLMLKAVEFLAKNHQPYLGLRKWGINNVMQIQWLKRWMMTFAQKA